MRKIFGLLIIVCIFLLTIPVYAADSDLVTIKDPNLKSIINTTLKKPVNSDITEGDMKTLSTISISNANVTSLEGIEYAINLKYLYAYQSGISDLTPIQNLKNLVDVKVNSAPLYSLPDLSKLIYLTGLDLDRTYIDNNALNEISKITSLKTIHFNNTNVTDISALANLPNLTTLFMQYTAVHDFTVLNNFPKLNNLAAISQSINQNNGVPKLIRREKLIFDEEAGTVFIPFSLMDDRLTNFDGYKPPFTTSTSSSNTYVGIDDIQIPSTRLFIDDNGITISGYTMESYLNIQNIEYSARFNNPNGSYSIPSGYISYSISNGIYNSNFKVSDTEILTDKTYIVYHEGDNVSESDFFKDINVRTNDGTNIKSDFHNVSFDKLESYIVTIKTVPDIAKPVEIIVIVIPKNLIVEDNPNDEVYIENGEIKGEIYVYDTDNGETYILYLEEDGLIDILPVTGYNVDILFNLSYVLIFLGTIMCYKFK